MRAPETKIQNIEGKMQVTTCTVSLVWDNHTSISKANKRAVNKTAESLHYSQIRIASSLRLGRTNILRVIIPNSGIDFFGSVVHGIEKVAKENGCSILSFQSNEQEAIGRRGAKPSCILGIEEMGQKRKECPKR